MDLAEACAFARTEAKRYEPGAVALLGDDEARLVAGLWCCVVPEWEDPTGSPGPGALP